MKCELSVDVPGQNVVQDALRALHLILELLLVQEVAPEGPLHLRGRGETWANE